LNNVLLGQTGWLNLALVAAFFAALLAKKDIPGGMALAFSTIKPQLLLLLFLPVLFLKRWQLLAVAFGCEMLLLLLAGSAVGFSNIIGYPGILLHAESAYARNGLNPELMVCLRAPLSLLLPQSMAFLISGLTVLAGAALICLLWRHADSAEKQIRATALSAVVYLIFSPHAFLYDCLLLIIPLLLTYPSNGLSKAFAQMTGNERGWLAILLLAPLLAWCPYLCHEAWATLFMLVVNLVLLLFGWTSRFAYLQPAILPEPEEAAGSDK
jgi:hypothetical protein